MDLLEQERKEKADIAIFFAAINEKSRDKLTPFLSDPKFNVNVKNSQGVPALLVAAKNGWFEGCELLLRHPQIEVNEQQKTMTTLHTLVLTIPKTPTQIAYLETVVELLISKGMDIDYQNEKKDTALHKALKMKNNPAIAILLKKGANFHIENQDGETALHIVIRNNDEATAKLLSKLFSINRQTRKKYDSYVVAILDRLFPQLPDKRKEEFFINAVAQDFLNQVRYFVDKKMDVNLYSPKEEKSLLEIAASEGHYATFTFLLNQPNIVVTRLGEWINKTAFYLIKKPPQTQTETLKLINLLRRLVKPKTIDIPNPRGETLVHEAAFRGNLAALNILLDLGASTSVRTM
jgi:ankyrin repeat protein